MWSIMPAQDPSHASVRASDTTMNGHPDDSEEEVYLSEAASTGEPEDVKTDDDYEYHEGEESGSEEGYGDAQSQGASAAGSPSNKLPFDLSSIIRRAAADADAAASDSTSTPGNAQATVSANGTAYTSANAEASADSTAAGSSEASHKVSRPAAAAPAEQEDQQESEDSLAASVAARAVAAAVAANSNSASSSQGPPPRGLPGLPPRGGLNALPPRQGLGGAGLGGGLPPRRTSESSGTATGVTPTVAAPPRPQPGGTRPFLPPRPAPAAGAGSGASAGAGATASATASSSAGAGAGAGAAAANPMLFRRAQPEAAAAAAPAQTAVPTSVLDGTESEKVRKVKLAVQKYRTDAYRIALRMKYPTGANMIRQLMQRLGMAERIYLGGATQAIGIEDLAQMEAERAEVVGPAPLDFSCTVMVLGLSGTGKSATINSLLGRPQPVGYKETGKVEVVRGEVAGIPITFIDTPGLEPSAAAVGSNLRKLHAAKRAFNRYKPKAVIYVDRLDVGRRDQADVNVLRTITEVFGQDVWFSSIILMTHGGAPPPDTNTGQPLALDFFYQQRGQQLQHMLRQVSGDQRLMTPTTLAENSPSCPRSAEGDLVLPSGNPWCRQLLMLLFTSKILGDAAITLKPSDSRGGARPPQQAFMGMKVPPLGWLLSRLVDFRSPRKPPGDEREIKHNDEIKRMPPGEQQVQLRKKRMYLKQRAEEARADAEGSVPILAPEPALAPSFDPDVTGYRYRVLEDPTGIISRPIVSDGAVDHEDGIDSVQIEKQTILRPRNQYLGGVPAVAWAQVQKDKTQFSFQGEVDGSYSRSGRWVSTAACNVQTIGRDVLYTPRVETRLKTGKRNKVAIGALFSKLGEDYSHPFKQGALAYGMKVDDRWRVLPNAKLRTSLGRMYTKAGNSYDHGTALAADLKFKPSSDETAQVLMGGTAVWQRRETMIGGNLSTEFKLPKADGRGGKSDTTCSMNANYNNKGQGQLVLRLNSHDYPQLAASMLVPLLATCWQKLFGKDEFA